jgi:hypothetical protein
MARDRPLIPRRRLTAVSRTLRPPCQQAQAQPSQDPPHKKGKLEEGEVTASSELASVEDEGILAGNSGGENYPGDGEEIIEPVEDDILVSKYPAIKKS